MMTVIDRAREAGIAIPLWVPERLRHEYADCALAYGEEVAASHVRKLKREIEDRAPPKPRRRPF